jgi:hypothetical protein
LKNAASVVVTDIVPSSPIPSALMMEAIDSSETSVFTRVTLHNIPENGILHGYCCEDIESYIALTGWAL